jgi:ABC-type amino acid transport substrate-binding protein
MAARLALFFGYVLKFQPYCYRFRQGRGPKMSKSGASLKVLYGELNEQVLAAQAASLQNAGYDVQAAVGRKGVQEALRAGKFDLVVLGPTLTRDDRHHLPYFVKKAHAGTRVLVMHTDGSRHPYVDGNTDTGEDMEHLIAKIGALPPKAAAATAGR